MHSEATVRTPKLAKRRARRNAVRLVLTAETAVTAVERELVLRFASLLWRMRRATAIETALLQIQVQIQAEMLSDRRYEYETGDDTGQKPQSVAYRVLQRAIAPSQHRHSGNGSSHLDQSDSTDDQCDPVQAPRDDPGGISRNLTYWLSASRQPRKWSV